MSDLLHSRLRKIAEFGRLQSDNQYHHIVSICKRSISKCKPCLESNNFHRQISSPKNCFQKEHPSLIYLPEPQVELELSAQENAADPPDSYL